jgi:hypothetical protein
MTKTQPLARLLGRVQKTLAAHHEADADLLARYRDARDQSRLVWVMTRDHDTVTVPPAQGPLLPVRRPAGPREPVGRGGRRVLLREDGQGGEVSDRRAGTGGKGRGPGVAAIPGGRVDLHRPGFAAGEERDLGDVQVKPAKE